jgi:hypothetical protein
VTDQPGKNSERPPPSSWTIYGVLVLAFVVCVGLMLALTELLELL